MSGYNVAVVGATGAVGEAMIGILAEREFPVNQLFPLASERSAGSTILFGKKSITVQDLADFDFSQTQIALFSAGGSVSAEYAPRATETGCIVIDNTSHFRYDADIPLIVPEVNPQHLSAYTNRNIIANPNCSTIQMLVALKPIYDAVGITRINVSTYQAVSGGGKSAIKELANQTLELMNGREAVCNVFAKQIAFNALPHIDDFTDNGYTREEMKMSWETKKIFDDENIAVNATCVRIPVFYSHSEVVNIETEKKISAVEVRELLNKAPGVEVMDKREPGGYPTAIGDSAGKDAVLVGRIREDISHPRGINLWVVADNVRKGAALNSIQIAEMLIKDYL